MHSRAASPRTLSLWAPWPFWLPTSEFRPVRSSWENAFILGVGTGTLQRLGRRGVLG